MEKKLKHPLPLSSGAQLKNRKLLQGHSSSSTIEKLVVEAHIKHPSIIIVGEVVNLRQKIKWFEEMNLTNNKQVEAEACQSSVN